MANSVSRVPGDQSLLKFGENTGYYDLKTPPVIFQGYQVTEQGRIVIGSLLACKMKIEGSKEIEKELRSMDKRNAESLKTLLGKYLNNCVEQKSSKPDVKISAYLASVLQDFNGLGEKK